eukprot:2070151-Pleurochrysis_carterae.AAC.11
MVAHASASAWARKHLHPHGHAMLVATRFALDAQGQRFLKFSMAMLWAAIIKVRDLVWRVSEVERGRDAAEPQNLSAAHL